VLSVYTRHYPPCEQKDPNYRRCKCPKWIQGMIGDQFVRRTAKTRSWEKAVTTAREMEEKAEPTGELPERVTVEAAIDAYLADASSRELAASTLFKLEGIFRRQFLSWTKQEGLIYLTQLTTAQLTRFRNDWKDGALAKKKKHERLIGFFFFCIRNGWIATNPAQIMGRVKAEPVPTDYFPREEFDRILDSTHVYQVKGYIECRNHGTRLRVLTQLMRWSGLRIQDAITLERSRLQGDNLLLYQAKTGMPVYVPLPADVAEALRTIPPGPKANPRYFFWSGNGDPRSAVKDWQRSFRKLFEIANIRKPDGTLKRCFPHMFRDTFAVEMLLAGVPLDQVSILLGHSSVKITEKHYSPWVKARQEQLEASVRKAWGQAPKPTTKRLRSRRPAPVLEMAQAAPA
jgi:integrase/recombinase XerD